MKIVGIFDVVKGNLYTVQFDNKEQDEFADAFEKWQDIEYLEQFFEDNIKDLQSGFFRNISIEEAVFRTTEEALKFEKYIKRAAFNSSKDPNHERTLDNAVFTSLHEDVYSYTHIESKAYGKAKDSWLRLYAIRLAENVYFISGGTIKLTKAMNNRKHLLLELEKLQKVKDHLKELDIIEEGDLGFLELGHYDEE